MSDAPEIEDTKQIARKRNVSGELFDLSVPTFNNEFGKETIEYAIRYGTASPLNKYIDELRRILDKTLDTDDKGPKRQMRLDFLEFCNGNIFIRTLFQLFTAYLNGGGSRGSDRRFPFEQYENQLHLVSVAGGNVFILFAQLLLNMTDTFITCANDIGGNKRLNTLNWDILWGNEKRNYNVDLNDYACGDDFLMTNINDWPDNVTYAYDNGWNGRGAPRPRGYWWTLNNGYNYLSATNKLLLNHLENYDFGLSKEELWYHISIYLLNSTSKSADDILVNVALSPHSDCDFKLTPNIQSELDSDNNIDYKYHHEFIDIDVDYGNGDDDGPNYPDDSASEVKKVIDDMESELMRSENSTLEDGFLLIRAKSLIIAEDSYTYYTTAQLREMKRKCARPRRLGGLGSIAYGLYPQIMQDSYLRNINEYDNPDCYRFLTYLQEKKRIISQATANNISEINKFFLAGVYAAIDSTGTAYSVSNLHKQANSTEALIVYLNNVTYSINRYIQAWEEAGDEDGISHWGAPGLRFTTNSTMQELNINYQNVCRSFLTLPSLMYDGVNLIPKLCSDILFNFVNNPVYQTEAILDSLIETVNIDRQKRSMPDAHMPESAITIAPNQPITFKDPLDVMKQIFENISRRDTDDMTAMPNGLRITINVVVADPVAPPGTTVTYMYDYNFDYGEDNVEILLNNIAGLQIESYKNAQEVPHSHYISFNSKQPRGRRAGKNIKKRRTRKKRKYKRTVRSKKNKSKAKRIRRTKKNPNFKKYKVTKNKKKSKKTRKK